MLFLCVLLHASGASLPPSSEMAVDLGLPEPYKCQAEGPGMIERRKTRRVMVGKVPVGGGAPVTVQSMTKTHTTDIDATVEQIQQLICIGCQIVRCAVPDMAAADALAEIRRQIDIPLVADIHFDHRLAVRALQRGADCIRINPGNIRSRAKLDRVIAGLRDAGKGVRIGVNSGSIRPRGRKAERSPLPSRERDRVRGESPQRPDPSPSPSPSPWKGEGAGGSTGLAALMVEEALRACEYFESKGVEQIKVSLKASDVPTTLAAYRAIAPRCDYPLHLGVTAAGPYQRAVVKSAIGIGALLSEGIGDTIRVSITGPPFEEVRLGHEILRAVGLEASRPDLISCPTCGRCRVDLVRVVAEVEQALKGRDIPLTIAVMGCEVNGPGEAAEADIGVAGAKGYGVIFRKGQRVRRVPESELVDELLREIEKL